MTEDINCPMQLQELIINFLRRNSPTGTRGLCKDLSKTGRNRVSSYGGCFVFPFGHFQEKCQVLSEFLLSGLNWVPHCVGVEFQCYLH